MHRVTSRVLAFLELNFGTTPGNRRRLSDANTPVAYLRGRAGNPSRWLYLGLSTDPLVG